MAEEFLNEAVEWERKGKEAARSLDTGYAELCGNLARRAFRDALDTENGRTLTEIIMS